MAIKKLTKREQIVNINFDLIDYELSESYTRPGTITKEFHANDDDKPALLHKQSVDPFQDSLTDKVQMVPPEATHKLEVKLDESYLGEEQQTGVPEVEELHSNDPLNHDKPEPLLRTSMLLDSMRILAEGSFVGQDGPAQELEKPKPQQQKNQDEFHKLIELEQQENSKKNFSDFLANNLDIELEEEEEVLFQVGREIQQAATPRGRRGAIMKNNDMRMSMKNIPKIEEINDEEVQNYGIDKIRRQT